MVLKIVSEVRENDGVLVLHGWLSGPEVAEFERVCASTPGLQVINLENLAGVDSNGLRALVAQRERGARLTGASPYIELLLSRHSTTCEPAGTKN
jgi:anti-anti-sigma regulatory factor